VWEARGKRPSEKGASIIEYWTRVGEKTERSEVGRIENRP